MLKSLGSNAASSYEDALRILAGCKRPARPATPADTALTATSRTEDHRSVTPDLRGTPSIVGMRNWLKELGHSDADLQALNVIHVAGTKGKGSTCAFTESLLRQHGKRTGYPIKTGLYTSPHLVLPQERIRLNFKPLSEAMFANYFFEVYNTLEHSTDRREPFTSPRYLQLWALVAFHTFIKQKVDVAVVETHHGGEYDATNFLQDPAVAVVTTLGMDHVDQLGPTLSSIAWHKAGIFKRQAAAISAPQADEALVVLRARAQEKNVQLAVVDQQSVVAPPVLDLPAQVLRTNCNVAVAAANAWIARMKPRQQLSNQDIVEGVRNFHWPGRFEQIDHGKNRMYLDAAHNELSVAKAAQWFAEATNGSIRSSNALLFSHISSHRDGFHVLKTLLRSLKTYGVTLDKIVLTSYDVDSNVPVKPDPISKKSTLQLCKTYAGICSEYFSTAAVYTEPTIRAALQRLEATGVNGNGCNVLATGSQHLLGGLLSIIKT